MYDLLKPYHNGVPNIDNFFASLVYPRLHTPMDNLANILQVGSKSTVSPNFYSWISTMYENLQPLVAYPDTETLRSNMPEAFRKHFMYHRLFRDIHRATCIVWC